MNLYKGVVENNIDPDKQKKVQVRIQGMHTFQNENSGVDFNYIPTESLPWAQIIGGTDFGLVGGIGISSVLRQGTWVWLILDHGDENKPIIIGTVTGTNSESPIGKYSGGEGFHDPEEQFPFAKRSAETDVNRLARSENLSDPYYDNEDPTIHKKINDSLDSVSVADGVSGADVSQNEPLSTDDLVTYTKNAVLETESGHVIQCDDTPNNERVRIYHRTGSYIEVKPDGTFIQKSVNTDGINHYIHMSDVNEHIAKGVKRFIEENLEEIIGASVKRNIKQNLTEHIEGNNTLNIDGSKHDTIGNGLTINVTGNITVTATGNITASAGGNVDVSAGGAASVSAGTQLDLTAGTLVSISAPAIAMN